jgi:cellulose synthase/poly-beta-1,6-N-acetylglucosamine synthase-like glycosyltransferase
MDLGGVLYALAVLLVVYTYLVYPALVLLLGRIRRRPKPLRQCAPRSISVVIAAYNEEATIGRRLQELTELLAQCGLDGEIIVVSDGSTDRTAGIARSFDRARVRVLEVPTNGGKATALSQGCALAQNEIILFADARQSWSPEAIRLLLENFADPTVGGASGDLVMESGPGVLAGVGLYWRYEKWLRRAESRVHSTVGVTGAISAVRRELFRPIPSRTILDDVYWPLQVAMQGYRVVHDGRARAYDRLPARTKDEFRRKVRTLAGNYQLLTCLPAALFPWWNPIWFQFLSHKVCRLLVPWALLTVLGLSVVLTDPVVRVGLWAQFLFYLVGLLGIAAGPRNRFRIASAAGSFLILNAAAWLGFWVWVLGRTEGSWRKVSYAPPPMQPVEAL